MRHHEQTIAAFTEAMAGAPDTLGVVVVGSVAQGREREDSDVDVYVVVTDDAYAAAARAERLAYVSDVGVAYPGGYVDVKLSSPGYLQAAALRGDDPTRASFERGRVTLDRTGTLTELVRNISEMTEGAWAGRERAYRAQLALYGGYFLGQAHDRGDRFLLQHSAVHAGLAAGRCALAHHRRLFRGQKYLSAELAALPHLPDGFLTAWSGLLEDPCPGTAQALTEVVDAWLGDPLTGDEALSDFIIGNELCWLNRTIPPEFW